MDWIVIQWLKLKIKRAEKRLDKEENVIVKKALSHLIENYKITILFLTIGN